LLGVRRKEPEQACDEALAELSRALSRIVRDSDMLPTQSPREPQSFKK